MVLIQEGAEGTQEHSQGREQGFALGMGDWRGLTLGEANEYMREKIKLRHSFF